MRLFRALVPGILLFFSTGVSASHVSGIDIEYTCLGNNQFEIFLSLYRDCSGITMGASQSVDIVSSCGNSTTVTLNQIPPAQWSPPAFSNEVSQLCSQDLPNSTCNGGTLPGMEQYIYSAIITLNPPCNSWTISWSTCCRNGSTNIPSSASDDMYGETVINTVTAPCNNSPQFTAQPIPYYCVGQAVNFSYGVYDPDGDSLAYELIDARIGPGSPMGYGAGYSGTSPIPGLTLDPFTGQMTFTPTMQGNYIVVVEVQEYNAAGDLIGTVMRDMQFVIIPCVNTVPPTPLTMTGFSGSATMAGPLAIDMCLGTDFCFDITFSDPDVNDSISLTSNVNLVLPGATLVQTGINPATAHICWTAVPGTANLSSFIVTANDNACPIPGIAPATITVQLQPGVVADPDVLVCSVQPVQLGASGGGSIQWATLSGDPIVVGVNFTCDTCLNPIATPAITTTYTLTSDLNTVCLNEDTVTITVVEPFDFGSLQVKHVTCNGGSDAWIKVNPTGTAGPQWTYELYDTGGALLQTVTSNTADTLTNLPIGTYQVRLIEPLGCFLDTTVTITQPDAMTIAVADTTVCQTTSAVLSAFATGGNGGFSYIWDQGLIGNGPHVVSPSINTNYTVYAQDNQGCVSATEMATVQLYPFLNVTPSGPDSICRDNVAFLQVAGAGGDGGPYSYTWQQVGGTVTTGGDTASVTPAAVSTQYFVIMTDACGSPSVQDTLNIGWYAPPIVNFVADKREDCFPAEINFTNSTALSSVGGTCVWDFGDGNTALGGCSTISHSYNVVGCYDVNLKVYSPEGCPGDSTYVQYVCARPFPEADFDFAPTSNNVFDTEVFFENLSIDGVRYEWIFGTGAVAGYSNETDPVVMFPNEGPGDYPTWLYTTNEFGCTDSILKTVIIDGVYLFYVPNAFSPDGDLVNDFFGPVGEGISTNEFNLSIFDRGGQEIYNSNDRYAPWDGSIGNGGTQAMNGVYVWRIEAVDEYTGIKREYIGHVSLLR